MRYIIEIWNGKDWELSERTNIPLDLRLNEYHRIPFIIKDEWYGTCIYHRADIKRLYMVKDQEIVIVYRTTKKPSIDDEIIDQK